ncbi:MAG: PKD domain-containing protein, partial [Anaerolineae bacterium]|nr:PKD domain-containing protein [Anaerolineae bacterium]
MSAQDAQATDDQPIATGTPDSPSEQEADPTSPAETPPAKEPADQPTVEPTDVPTEQPTNEPLNTPTDIPPNEPTGEPLQEDDAPPAEFVPSFNVSPQQGNAPLTVNVTDTTSGDPTNWTWSFGDGSGNVSGQASASHTYNQPGAYTITLTVSNDANSGQATHQV